MKFGKKKKRKVLINITSLIDVLFLLLIFFMVSSTFIENPGMDLELPESESSTLKEIKDLILQINPDGRLFLNSREVYDSTLESSLQTEHLKNPEAALILKADKNVIHGRVVQVMDAARKLGITKLIIATEESRD